MLPGLRRRTTFGLQSNRIQYLRLISIGWADGGNASSIQCPDSACKRSFSSTSASLPKWSLSSVHAVNRGLTIITLDMSTTKNQTHSPGTGSISTYIIVFLSFTFCAVAYFILSPNLGTPRYLASNDQAKLPNLQQSRSQYQSFINFFTSRTHYEESAALKTMASDKSYDRIAFYKQKRDEFRNNPTAMAELAKWKNHDNDCEYTVL